MNTHLPLLALSLLAIAPGEAAESTSTSSGFLLPGQPGEAQVWWARSSAAKIRPTLAAPQKESTSIQIRAARNETDAAQLVIRPQAPLEGLNLTLSHFLGPDGAIVGGDRIEILRVLFLEVQQATDRSSAPGLWPDPLLPLRGAVDLEPESNHVFWIRVAVPRNQPGGTYRGQLKLRGDSFRLDVPVELTVYDFDLPDKMTCTTAFGFSPGLVARYHGLETDEHRRLVLDLYLRNLAAHHISPYNPAPYDPIKVTWPDIRPPKTTWDDWTNLRIVSNEAHGGRNSLLIYDDQTDENTTVTYEPLIEIPAQGLRVKAWYRTAVPGHRFLVSLNHYDQDRRWMSGRNNDITLSGSGAWQHIDELLTGFPSGAVYVRLHARATTWTDDGEKVGLVWLDDLSVTNPETGQELLAGGDFERRPRTQPVVPLDELQVDLDFTAWDGAMTRAIDELHFNSFRLGIPGIGGGTFHAISPPQLLGFTEDTPEYGVLFDQYCRQLEAHLRTQGWLDEAFVYWFDEPSVDQYPFVMNGFSKLKRSSPGIARMLTEQVEPALVGGPNIWCSISNNYDHERAETRRRHGEKFWWYVCTGPKAPYAGLFIDHPAPELRIWLWQTFQRNIEGILVWQANYWTSSAAYPEGATPQNPYEDPMSWRSGYSTPAGERRPWGNGDGRFIYPPLAAADGQSSKPVLEGPVDSIRWEHLRDGIEDYEYLCLLRRLIHERNDELSPAEFARMRSLLQVPEEITRTLTDFAKDGEPIELRRHEIARAIEALD